jgi:hypothetical protein
LERFGCSEHPNSLWFSCRFIFNGCITNASAELTQPQPLIFTSVDTVDVICKGGSEGRISVALTGGTLPYIYEWNNGLPDTNIVENLPSLATPYTLTVRDANNCINDSFSYIIKEPADSLDIIIVDTIQNPCFGNELGTIEINGFGGWGTYEFSLDSIFWSSNGLFSNLGAANYKTFVRDYRGCVNNKHIEVTQPDTLIAIVQNVYTISCVNYADGALLAQVTGGTMPYSYLWDDALNQTNDTADNLAAGTYIVLVTDANSCTDTAYSTLSQPTRVTIASIDTADIVCFGGSDGHIGLDLQGGTPPYSYSWSPAQADTNYIDLLPEGTYEVHTFDNNGCAGDTFVYQVKSPAAALSIIEVQTAHIDNLCFSDAMGELKVRASGGWGTYQYSTDLSVWQKDSVYANLPALVYTISARDTAGCIENVNVEITQPAQLQITAASSENTITASASGGTPPYSFSLNGGAWQSSGQYNGLAAGTYHVQVRDDNNCGPVQSNALILETGINLVNDDFARIYPNPTNGLFYIEFIGTTAQELLIEIYSLTGARIYENVYQVSVGLTNTVQIDMTDIPQGVYMVKVNGNLLRAKLVKE